MPTAAAMIKQLREAHEWDLETLAAAAAISPKTLRQYESGRAIQSETAKKLARAFFGSSGDGPNLDTAEARDFLECLNREIELRSINPLNLPIDSNDATIRGLSLDYAPFSGTDKDKSGVEKENSERFLDLFLRKLFQLSVINLEEPDFAKAASEKSTFDIVKRISLLESDRADLIVNLSSLQRLRRVHFFPTTIRVSLNAVVFNEDGNESSGNLGHLKTFLTSGVSAWEPLNLLAVRNEVGYVYLTQSLKIPPSRITPLSTIDPTILADQLRKYRGEKPLLVCDEVTAMGTVTALKGQGMLVLQPCTDEAVLTDKRMVLPAFPLAIGVKRENNDAMINYLSSSLQAFLALEPETIAALLHTLYDQLVSFAKETLSCDQNLYLGGTRRIIKDRHPEFAPLLADQNARAFARRCLQVSAVSLRNLAPELEPWRPVLRRVRRLIHIDEARNRSLVKGSLIAALKTVYGLDPVEDSLESLALAFNKDKEEVIKRSASGLLDPRSDERWSALKYILERDLDLEVPSEREGFFKQPRDLEPLISEIQNLLESSGQTSSVTVIELLNADSRPVYERLWLPYIDRYAPVGSTKATVDDPFHPVFLVRNLGEPVGFLQATLLNKKRSRSLCVDHLYFVEHMRNLGMSRRVIRAAINYAHEQGCDSVSTLNQRSDIVKKFCNCGFTDPGDLSLQYQLDRLEVRSAQKDLISPPAFPAEIEPVSSTRLTAKSKARRLKR